MSTIYQYQHQFPTRSSSMANVPEAYSSTAPEVCNSTVPEVCSSTDPETYCPPQCPEWSEVDRAQISYFESSPDTICGLKRKTFWITLIGMFIVIAAGIVGVLASSKKNKGVLSGSETSPTPTSKTKDSGVVIFTATGTTATVAATSSSTTTSRSQPMAGSNYAIVSWNKTFAIFYQDNDAMIRMVGFDLNLESGNILNYTWSKPTDPLNPSRSIRYGTSISAVSFYSTTTRREARVYLTNTDNILEEWEWNSEANGWVTNLIGSNSGITVSPNSQVTATIFSTNTAFQIFVFYQNRSDRLAGMVYTKEVLWETTLKFSGTAATDWPLLSTVGSGLAVVYYPDTALSGVRIYYQDINNKLNWFQGRGTNFAAAKQSWGVGTLSETLPGNIPLSAIVVPTLNDRMLQLFYTQNSRLVSDTYNASGIATSDDANKTSDYLGSGGIAASGPGVATITWDESMVLVVTGEKNWFNIWQYTPWNGQWSNPGVPTGYFGTR